MDVTVRGSPRDPSVAATWVALTAVVITLGWNVWFVQSIFIGLTPLPVLPLLVLFPPVNAYVVTYVFWNRYVPREDPLTYRRGAGVGVVATAVSYVTLAVTVALCYTVAINVGFAPAGTTPVDPLFTFAVMSGVILSGAVFYTLGTPVIATLAVAFLLARRDEPATDVTARTDAS